MLINRSLSDWLESVTASPALRGSGANSERAEMNPSLSVSFLQLDAAVTFPCLSPLLMRQTQSESILGPPSIGEID